MLGFAEDRCPDLEAGVWLLLPVLCLFLCFSHLYEQAALEN